MHFWSPQMRAEGSEKLLWPSFSDRSLCTFVEAIPLFDNVDLITPLTLLQLFWHPLNQQFGHIQGVFLSSRWNMPKQLHFQMRTSHFLRKMVNFGQWPGWDNDKWLFDWLNTFLKPVLETSALYSSKYGQNMQNSTHTKRLKLLQGICKISSPAAWYLSILVHHYTI